jgi:hypothetical protein
MVPTVANRFLEMMSGPRSAGFARQAVIAGPRSPRSPPIIRSRVLRGQSCTALYFAYNVAGVAARRS